MLEEFKKFAMRGNVADMAVGPSPENLQAVDSGVEALTAATALLH